MRKLKPNSHLNRALATTLLLTTSLGIPVSVQAGPANGLLRTIWGCRIPCATKGGHELLPGVEVSYCSTSTLSLTMIQAITPVCQERNHRSDAVALRSTEGAVATCDSAGNPCPTEGLVPASFTCKVLCPSQDSVIHKFTACASSGTEAWSYATQICPDARSVPASVASPWDQCTPDGDTGCP